LIVYVVLTVFLVLLFARFVVDWVMVLARSWRPAGVVAAGLEVVYSTTDPPLKAVRRVIPPLNLGTIRLDLGFMVVLIAVVILRGIVGGLAR
jgi:YggT family protein